MTNRKASIGAASRPIGRMATGVCERTAWARLEPPLQSRGNTTLAGRNAEPRAPAGGPRQAAVKASRGTASSKVRV